MLLAAILFFFIMEFMKPNEWSWENKRIFIIINMIALLIAEWKFHTIIHKRYVSAGQILQTICYLVLTQAIVSYLLMRHLMFWTGAGWLILSIAGIFYVVLLVARLLERYLVKWLRKLGRNTRSVTLVGSDQELRRIFERMRNESTMGYRFRGYYSDTPLDDAQIDYLGSLQGLMADIEEGKEPDFGDELFVSISRKEKEIVRKLSLYCDKHVTQFYFVPLSVETLGMNLQREYIHDIEVFTTYGTPLQNPVNRLLKRVVDILLSLIALVIIGIMLPFVYLIVKLQSPGPLFFKQLRTGMDGKDFTCYKFRSMHVNEDADKLQATKDDPRKFPFGNFMRKMNIDELPQFWNVLIGDMSVVGPRPHMLAHTDMYSKQIDQYMVRHFVKPGVTGWAQVTGFRGETKELWQMEERVKRDIWYMEHWSCWLDIRILWMTFKQMIMHDKHAY
ncbi:MAG: exopolysaccharide biosynthesis polyprenyl glycosylphosphotransferase [Prevotella sp.]|nr:exopolysaccharide biosynthesis polyprenyl glycosylphosphotransferase [Prevotella sp.]